MICGRPIRKKGIGLKTVNCKLMTPQQFWHNIRLLMDMKKIVFILLFLVAKVSFSQTETVKEIKTTFKSNNIKDLSKTFNNSLKVRVLNEDGMYSRSQAESVLSNFMKKYPISDFQIIHQGESKEGGLHYAVCKYISANQAFRVYILLKQNGGEYLIDTIDFSME